MKGPFPLVHSLLLEHSMGAHRREKGERRRKGYPLLT